MVSSTLCIIKFTLLNHIYHLREAKHKELNYGQAYLFYTTSTLYNINFEAHLFQEL